MPSISTTLKGGSKHALSAKALGQRSLERIGNTPLLRLDRIAADFPNVTLLGKAEWVNPGGSVKDRAASNIVAEGRASGNFSAGKILLDSTSGNTGIAYAMIAAAQGFPVTLCMPSNVSIERKRILHAYGANIIYTDPDDGSDGAIRKARELYAAEPDKYFYADQYSNDANWRAHYLGTANEIWQQSEGHITHFVSMLGTSGTFVGTSRRLKELNSKIRCISNSAASAARRSASPRRRRTPIGQNCQVRHPAPQPPVSAATLRFSSATWSARRHSRNSSMPRSGARSSRSTSRRHPAPSRASVATLPRILAMGCSST